MDNAIKAAHEKAFALVDPAEHAKRLAAAGLITAEQAATKSWKDAIAAVVTDAELKAAGVTIDGVARAIEFFTATTAKITRERIAVRVGKNERGFLVLAAGYRNGPAA